MGYRFIESVPKPDDMLTRFDVRNGAIMRLAFGCYYSNIHDMPAHDHIGWPTPTGPDDICQMSSDRPWYAARPDAGNVVKMDPIQLQEEGYTSAAVAYDDSTLASNLETRAWIDGNIVKMTVRPKFSSVPENEPIEAKFTLFIKKRDNSAIDAVCRGIVLVLPGKPYPN